MENTSNITYDNQNWVSKGKFFFIYEDESNFILVDKTKKGLEVKETSIDEKNNVLASKGMIYDMDGIGHKVPIRWFYPKDQFSLDYVNNDAQIMENKYIKIREMTCPDEI